MPKDDRKPTAVPDVPDSKVLLARDLMDRVAREQASDRAVQKWEASPDRRRIIVGAVISVLGSIMLAVLIGVCVYVVQRALADYDSGSSRASSREDAFTTALVLIFALPVGCAAYFYAAYSRRRRIFLERKLRENLAHELAAITGADKGPSDNPDLEFGTRWALTHKTLEYYHGLATRQAEVSFRHAQGAMIGGFVVALIAMVIALLPSSVGKSVVVGSIGSVVAVLAAYISKTFLRSQEIASSHLRAYFLQPLESSRYLNAERLVSSLHGDKQDDGLMAIIQGIAQSRTDRSNELS